MKSAGSTLLFFGFGSIVLYLIDYEFAVLAWIENWGEAVGWGIRGAVVVVGAILFFLGMRGEADEGEPRMTLPLPLGNRPENRLRVELGLFA